MGAPDLTLATTVTHWIAGRTAPGTSGRTQDVFNPATGEVARQVALASAEDVNAAVAAARPPFRRGPTRRRSAARACCSSSSSCSTSIATRWPR